MKRGYIFLCSFCIALLMLYSIRAFSLSEVDDVSPEIECSQDLLDKNEILWIIPFYGNSSIAENISWCNEILSLNKTLGLHGVYHTYKEFSAEKDSDYLNNGISAFEKCFGYKPVLFKPPQLSISKLNKNLIKSKKLKLKTRFNQVMHKVYHCNDTGKFSNRFIDVF